MRGFRNRKVHARHRETSRSARPAASRGLNQLTRWYCTICSIGGIIALDTASFRVAEGRKSKLRCLIDTGAHFSIRSPVCNQEYSKMLLTR